MAGVGGIAEGHNSRIEDCRAPCQRLLITITNLKASRHHVDKELRNCPSRIEDCQELRIAKAMPGGGHTKSIKHKYNHLKRL